MCCCDCLKENSTQNILDYINNGLMKHIAKYRFWVEFKLKPHLHSENQWFLNLS